MIEKLDEIMEKSVGNIPSQVQLNLPKLKKSDTNISELKLPKLKKITNDTEVSV
jgi:hypothetical protein